jgi:glycosyltransferase involved in cell wall biosynthesis
MGRYIRPLLRGLAARAGVELTLLVRDPRHAATYAAIVGPGIRIAPVSAARTRRAFDRVWYPWNGMRFGTRAPAVVTVNDDFAFRFPARDLVARWREQQPIVRAVRAATRILTISTWSRDALAARFALRADRIAILPLLPDAFFSPGTQDSPFAEPFVLAVGAGEARKNIAFLLTACERAFPERDVRLVVVGTPSAPLAARLRTARIPTAVIRRSTDDDLRRLYRTAAAVAVPSLAEGFGLVAAEAQACGAAVIAANVTALPQAVGAAGLLADPADGEAWCAGLRTLVRDPIRNAHFRALARERWADARIDATLDALLGALERAGNDRP